MSSEPVNGRWGDIPIDYIEPNGYVRLRHPQHPLAHGSRGVVHRHRVVLYAARGPLPVACEFCGFVLPWQTTSQPAYRFVINVDHINNVPGDDRLANLRPLCWWCNANRTWGEAIAPVWYERLRRWFATVHPAERPHAPTLVAEVLGISPSVLVNGITVRDTPCTLEHVPTYDAEGVQNNYEQAGL